MNKENKKIVYSFTATGTIIEWAIMFIVMFIAGYGFFLFVNDLINYLIRYYN